MVDKKVLLKFCTSFVNDRVSRIQENISGVQESLTSETKSSAGDKHETGRAMLQLEREKLGQQLLEAEKIRQTLSKVIIKNTTKTIGLGSLVFTAKNNYFLAISAGGFKSGNTNVYCISTDTPIGKLILGKSKGDNFVFNDENIAITEVV
tara:strand:- start:15734 stop:16183 length:450 start_codon:yes stop_codon:yes gene_type:complete